MSDPEMHPPLDLEQNTPVEVSPPPEPGDAPQEAGRPVSQDPASQDVGLAFVRIVGIGEGIVVRILDQDNQWAQAVEMLAQHLAQADGFFQDEAMELDVGARRLEAEELELIGDVLAAHRITIAGVRTTNPDTLHTVQELGLAATLLTAPEDAPDAEQARREAAHRWEVVLGKQGAAHPAQQEAAEFEPPQAIADALAAEVGEAEIPAHGEPEKGRAPSLIEPSPIEPSVTEEGEDLSPGPGGAETPRLVLAPPYLYRGALRSGQVFRHAGPVIVLGDVNPGAEIISGGDVLVWGRLRGMVHAGAMGDETAIVAALDFEPVQLRIAGHIAMSPKGASEEPGRWFWKRSPVGKPEVARLVNNQIVVDMWDARR